MLFRNSITVHCKSQTQNDFVKVSSGTVTMQCHLANKSKLISTRRLSDKYKEKAEERKDRKWKQQEIYPERTFAELAYKCNRLVQ